MLGSDKAGHVSFVLSILQTFYNYLEFQWLNPQNILNAAELEIPMNTMKNFLISHQNMQIGNLRYAPINKTGLYWKIFLPMTTGSAFL